ncbi:MAG: cytochrome c3 family protein [Mariprofundaceae bacterium]
MKARWIAPLLVLIAVLGLAPALAAAPIHANCATCHGSGDAPGASNLLRPLSALCMDCHAEQHGSGEHVVDVVPTTLPQLALPLQSGLMTCVTCHDPHASIAGMLRLPSEKLCTTCHDK